MKLALHARGIDRNGASHAKWATPQRSAPLQSLDVCSQRTAKSPVDRSAWKLSWRALRSWAAFSLPLLALAPSATAHNLAPAYLELRELARGEVAVLWKLPAVMPRGARLEPRLPCPDASSPTARAEAEAVVFTWRLACSGALVGQRIAVRGLADSGTDAIVRIALADGRELRAILSASEPSLVVPERERAGRVLASYGWLGVEHLWTGLDHLLFVAGLTLLLGASRRLVVAITAFTAGHSATLALAALGVVHVPQRLVEIAIAATIVALALSLAREAATRGASASRATDPRQPAVVARDGRAADLRPLGIARRPALLPFAFGLLHGLGFAGALGELGLPQHAIPLALFAFNAGIELGQLAAVALLLAGAAAPLRLATKRRESPRFAALAHEAATTAIGTLGVFWSLERAAGWLFP
jgi:hypothetical protein